MTKILALSLSLFVSILVCPPVTAQVDCETGAPAPNAALFYMQDQYYFDRQSCFDQLPFEVGEYTVIPGPTAQFVDLLIPTYQGLPRLGELYQYSPDRNLQDASTIHMAVQKRFGNDMAIYTNLIMLQLFDEWITADVLLNTNNEQPQNQRLRLNDMYTVEALGNVYAPRQHLASLAASLLTVDAANQYFCTEAQNCYQGEVRGQGFAWGGVKGNEFAARRAFQGFISDEFPAIKAWAQEVSTEVYMVWQVILDGYDFDKEAFALTPVIGRNITSGQYVGYTFMPREDGPQYLDSQYSAPSNPDVEFMLPMSIEEAESFEQEHRFIFAVAKVQIYGMHNGSTRSIAAPGRNNYYYGRQALFELAEPTIELFEDSFLTNKLHEIELLEP